MKKLGEIAYHLMCFVGGVALVICMGMFMLSIIHLRPQYRYCNLQPLRLPPPQEMKMLEEIANDAHLHETPFSEAEILAKIHRTEDIAAEMEKTEKELLQLLSKLESAPVSAVDDLENQKE